MRKVLVIGIVVVIGLPLLGTACFDKKNKPLTTSSSTASLTTTRSNTDNVLKEHYYVGTIGEKKVRLVYWSNNTEVKGTVKNRWFFDGMYVYEGESAEPLRLKLSFTSGGRFSASGYQVVNGEVVSNSAHFESTDECEGANEEGVLCGEWRDTKSKKVLPFTFMQTEKFIIEDYLKH